MRRPTSVPQADRSIEGFGVKRALKINELALGTAHAKTGFGQYCDPGRIVTAIFKPSQSIQQDCGALTFSDITNDSTHAYLRVGRAEEVRPTLRLFLRVHFR